MKTVGVYEARTRWSEIIREVEQGEVYVITRRGRPIAQLVRDVESDDDTIDRTEVRSA